MKQQQFLQLKKDMEELLKRYSMITPRTQGQIVVHVNLGKVSKIWENVDSEGRIIG